MPVINIEKAMVHLRVDEDTGGDVLAKLNSAEDKAARYLNRFFYATATEWTEAIAIALEQLNYTLEQYTESCNAANLVTDSVSRKMLLSAAENLKKEAQYNTKMTMQGIVINPSIEAAVLLILGSLYENREDETSIAINELPKGALWLLDPYRLDLGV
jgi:hypothetical protein